MNKREWKSFCESIRVRYHPQFPVLPKPTDQNLDDFESAYQFQLPRRYREFAKFFGAGVLATTYNIYAPGYRDLPKPQAGPRHDLGYFLDNSPRLFHAEFETDNTEVGRIHKLVYFCATTYGNIIGWDPGDPRDSRKKEYGIYESLRGEESLKYLAASFPEFVEQICFGPPDCWEEEWDNQHPSVRVFEPAWEFADHQE